MNSNTKNGIETIFENNLTKEQYMTKLMSEILALTCENFKDDQKKEITEKTSKRFIKYLFETTEGYQIDLNEIVNDALFPVNDYKEMIIVNDIAFNSTCEHHLLPFFGYCSIGYLPKVNVLGLSKFPRIVEAISKKFYLQENLTKDIATNLDGFLKSFGVIVIMSAKHSCMCYRGIESHDSNTQTIYRTGLFKEKEYLDQFYSLLKSGSRK